MACARHGSSLKSKPGWHRASRPAMWGRVMRDSRKTRPSRPRRAVQDHCKWCTNGSAHDVRLCASTRCPLWPHRSGRKPAPDDIVEVSALRIYPEEDLLTSAQLFGTSGSVLKAIARRCLDCSGGSKSEVRNCQRVDCDLHHLRLGRNPNRAPSTEQRKIKAARLKANIERAKNATLAELRKSPDPRTETGRPAVSRPAQASLGHLGRKSQRVSRRFDNDSGFGAGGTDARASEEVPHRRWFRLHDITRLRRAIARRKNPRRRNL